MQKYWEVIVDLLERASQQRHILALRDGMIGSVPVILVGSTFLLLGAQGPVLTKYFPELAASPLGLWYLELVPSLMLPFRFTMGLLSIYVAFTIAAALAKQYDLPQVPNGLTAVACLLVSGEMLKLEIHEGKAPEWVLPAEPLGAEGLFLAIILGLATVELSRRLTFLPKSPDGQVDTGGIPPAVVQAFASFLPMLVAIFCVWLIRHGFQIDIHQFILDKTSWLKELGDTYGAVVIVNLLLHLFGVAGVHGISVINAGMLPIWLEFLAANALAHEDGQTLPYVTAYPLYQFFIWLGGAGATLSATVRCLMSKNAHVKRIGKISLVPALFNINEPLLFGLPVVANPLLAIPFIGAPLACGTVAFYATEWGLVGRTFIEVPWVIPCFFGAFLSTQDPRAFLVLGVNLLLSYAIWAPFIRAYERKLDSGAALPNPEVETSVESEHPAPNFESPDQAEGRESEENLKTQGD